MDYGDIKKILFKLNPETAHKIAELAMRTSVKIPFVSDYFVDNFCGKIVLKKGFFYNIL